jgi:hypothetical protein
VEEARGGRGSLRAPPRTRATTPRLDAAPGARGGTAASVLRARPGAVVLRPAGRGGRGSRTRGGPDYSRTRVSRLFSTSLRARPARAPRAAGPRPTSSRSLAAGPVGPRRPALRCRFVRPGPVVGRGRGGAVCVLRLLVVRITQVSGLRMTSGGGSSAVGGGPQLQLPPPPRRGSVAARTDRSPERGETSPPEPDHRAAEPHRRSCRGVVFILIRL